MRAGPHSAPVSKSVARASGTGVVVMSASGFTGASSRSDAQTWHGRFRGLRRNGRGPFGFLQHGAKNFQKVPHLPLRHDKWRQQPDHMVVGAVNDQPATQGGGNVFPPLDREINADHQALAAYLVHEIEPRSDVFQSREQL